MAGLGTVINAAAVILGALIGLLLKKAIPEGMKKSIVQALSLATVAIGLIGVVTAACTVKDGAVESRYSLLMVISIAVGTFVGALCDIEARLDRLGEIMQKKFSSGSSMFAEGFVTASLVFCIGSMAILGSLRDGIYHDPTILITKGMIDGVMSVIFASTLGVGVVFSAATVVLYQGIITACASLLAPLLTEAVIAQLSLVGSILIIGIGLNLLYEPKLKLANMLPSVFVPLVWYIIRSVIK